VKSSLTSINRKIEKELGLQKKLSFSQKKLISDINYQTKNIESKNEAIDVIENDIRKLDDEIADQEHKLKGYDKYRDIKDELNKLESELKLTKLRIDDSTAYIKETLINKWMLNGCDHLINASVKNLNILNDEIKVFQNTTNPVPISLPGPEYVEQMIEDNICYICEREVNEGTPAYEALKKRLNDFEDNSNHKILQDNYTELNRSRKKLMTNLPDINDEIKQKNKDIDLLIKKRTRLVNNINSVYTDSGHEKEFDISIGAATASQILSKIQTFRSSKERKVSSLRYQKSDLLTLNENLKSDLIKKEKTLVNIDTNFVESVASDYIKMFVKSIGQLRSIAYSKLIDEIQSESNRLYSLYLGGETQGEILIDNGINIIDRVTKNVLTNLNTGEIVAQKLAVANSFLSLSEKKMKKAYPLVADAPTSDLDHINTSHLTINIGKSFEQMIIMSKDYAVLNSKQRDSLIKDANIVKYYEFKKGTIDVNELNSRTNKKTYITEIV
ncbi:hypothetical protein JYT50_01165, partial [bacterium AH-315-A23]|nr:hypothetical protein [bacterium AH-315-A23]